MHTFPETLLATDDLGPYTVYLPEEDMAAEVKAFNESAIPPDAEPLNPKFEEWDLIDPDQGIYEYSPDHRTTHRARMIWNATQATYEVDEYVGMSEG